MRVMMFVLLVAGVISLGDAARIHAKAILAQYLIQDAWEETLEQGPMGRVKPWQWADTWPVARVRFPEGRELFVLSGGHGSALAFGPGHLDGTVLPGERGASVVAGHRDTHFALLEKLRAGEGLMVQNTSGHWTRYNVYDTQIVDTRDSGNWWVDPTQDELHLVTCYPFDAIAPGGPLRYVVSARSMD